MFEGKSFSIFDDGSIEIETGSGREQFKNSAELRAAAKSEYRCVDLADTLSKDEDAEPTAVSRSVMA